MGVFIILQSAREAVLNEPIAHWFSPGEKNVMATGLAWNRVFVGFRLSQKASSSWSDKLDDYNEMISQMLAAELLVRAPGEALGGECWRSSQHHFHEECMQHGA